MAAISKLASEVIPADPTLPDYRQGNTLGEQHRHWFRVKFFQQYRLFFRYHAQTRIIVLAWVNDDSTKRAHDSSDDAYRVFKKMPESGHPPDDWDSLLDEARSQAARTQRAPQANRSNYSGVTRSFQRKGAKAQRTRSRRLDFLALRPLHLCDFALEAGFSCPAE